MDERGNTVKTEKFLLGLTALFLIFLLALYFRDRRVMEASPVSVEVETAAAQEAFMPDVSPVDVNTASAEELAGLPGIGGVLAGRIVEYREEHGPFETVEELLLVSGIGEKKLAELEGYVAAGG